LNKREENFYYVFPASIQGRDWEVAQGHRQLAGNKEQTPLLIFRRRREEALADEPLK
jgi:hypothetical protein